MTLFLRELARNRKQFYVWTIVLVLANIGMMAFFPSMREKAKMINELYSQFPKEVIAAVSLDKLDFSNIISFFAYIFQYIILFGGIYAMLLGASIISKEEGDKTIEFLLAKPITRTSIVTSKVLCVLTYLVLFNIIFALTNYAVFEAVKKENYSMKVFMLLEAGFFLLQVTFAAIGLFISMFVTRAKTVYPVSLGVVLGTYFFSIVSVLSEKFDNLKYFTPFKYVNPADLAADGRIKGVYLVIMAVVVAVMIAGTYIVYNKKNITV